LELTEKGKEDFVDEDLSSHSSSSDTEEVSSVDKTLLNEEISRDEVFLPEEGWSRTKTTFMSFNGKGFYLLCPYCSPEDPPIVSSKIHTHLNSHKENVGRVRVKELERMIRSSNHEITPSSSSIRIIQEVKCDRIDNSINNANTIDDYKAASARLEVSELEFQCFFFSADKDSMTNNRWIMLLLPYYTYMGKKFGSLVHKLNDYLLEILSSSHINIVEWEKKWRNDIGKFMLDPGCGIDEEAIRNSFGDEIDHFMKRFVLDIQGAKQESNKQALNLFQQTLEFIDDWALCFIPYSDFSRQPTDQTSSTIPEDSEHSNAVNINNKG